MVSFFFLHVKDPYEAKYQFLINKSENTGIRYLYDSKTFIEYLNDMDDIFKNIEEYNPIKKRKILVVFDDMISDTLGNQKPNQILTEYFIRGRKPDISLVFITQSYFAMLKKNRLNSTHYFIWKFQTNENFNKLILSFIRYWL